MISTNLVSFDRSHVLNGVVIVRPQHYYIKVWDAFYVWIFVWNLFCGSRWDLLNGGKNIKIVQTPILEFVKHLCSGVGILRP